MRKIEEISQRLIRGQKKLEEIRKQYDADSKKISELVQKRAGLMADEAIESDPKRRKEIDEVNKEIENLKRVIESRGPELVSALEKKLQGIQAEKSNEELRLSFERQKIVGKKAVDLSKQLIEKLEACNLINDELRKVWTEYASLNVISKKGTIGSDKKTTLGSFQSLQMLLNVLKYEYSSGKPRSEQQCRIMQW